MPRQEDLRDSKIVYDEQADAFANRAPKLLTWEFIGKPTIERYVRSSVPKREDARGLDVGSASGRVVELLISLGFQAKNITGVEISPNEVEIAKKKIPEAVFIVGDITEVKLEREKYDLVTCYMVWEFLDQKQLEKALKNLFEAMKPGGMLIYGTTHPERYVKKYGMIHEGWVKTGGPWGGDFENWYRGVDTFLKATRKSGFKIQDVEELEMPIEAIRIAREQPDRYSSFTSFGVPARLFVVARKSGLTR